MTVETVESKYIEQAAIEACESFETSRREDGTEYVRRTDSAPSWVADMVRAAHGDSFPDDWVYRSVLGACYNICDQSGADDAESIEESAREGFIEPDVYNADRTAWLAGNLGRAEYCNAAAREFGLDAGNFDIFEVIGLGQSQQKAEIFGEVWAAITARALEIQAEAEAEDVDVDDE